MENSDMMLVSKWNLESSNEGSMELSKKRKVKKREWKHKKN
jgi:hypothetical protein